MVDRINLIRTLEPLIAPTATEREALRKSLDKALVSAALTLPLDQARLLEKVFKDELEIVLRDMLVAGDLKKLAKKWEPARKVDAEMQHSLRTDLIDLLQDRRPVFEGLKSLDLDSARAKPERARATIQKSLPTADAKKLLKVWTKAKTLPPEHDEIIAQLLAVLDNDQPASRIA